MDKKIKKALIKIANEIIHFDKDKSINEFTDFIYKMEGEYIHRLTEQSGIDPADLKRFKLTYAEEFQGKLYDYVMTDFDLAKVTVLNAS